jgi:colanic acid biosynthesis protein WcaH
MILPEEQYAKIMEVLPILCVDIMIQNPEGEYLLIKRVNEPLKGQWWVIGGRVFKGETLKEAAIRKVREEVGLHIRDLKLVGYYEDTKEKSPFGLSTPQHSVSVVFSAVVAHDQRICLDAQSSEWKFSKLLPERFRCVLDESRKEPVCWASRRVGD